MGLERTTEKLDKYFKRLNKGKASKIKPSHVAKVLAKLLAKADLLRQEIAQTEKQDKKQRLTRKLELVHEQLERATWLQEKIGAL